MLLTSRTLSCRLCSGWQRTWLVRSKWPNTEPLPQCRRTSQHLQHQPIHNSNPSILGVYESIQTFDILHLIHMHTQHFHKFPCKFAWQILLQVSSSTINQYLLHTVKICYLKQDGTVQKLWDVWVLEILKVK